MVWSGIGAPPSRHRRTWPVRIFDRGRRVVHDYIDTSEPHLADALLAAIVEAERRGWHRVTVTEDRSPHPPDAPAIDRGAAEDRARAAHLRKLSAGSHGIDGGATPRAGGTGRSRAGVRLYYPFTRPIKRRASSSVESRT